MTAPASRTDTGTQTAPQRLTAPHLPAAIGGDGRYVMSLLTDFCTEVTDEVNRLGNALTSEAIPTDIDSFFVTFDREGVLWEWNSVPTATHYELTAGTLLLERTELTTSRAAPPTYSGSVTLTAYLADGTRLARTLDYTKPRPHAPTNVTLSRTSLGIRVSYDEIPPDCIGAQITAGGQTYRTTQTDCLLKTADERLGTISLAYYDSFGIGAVTAVTTEVPVVTGFFAEQNGEWLDLTWDSIPIADLRYTVKIAHRTPDWDSAAPLITVRADRARLRYPQAGTATFLIKAFDPYGNASPTAARTTLDRAADYRRNVLVTLDQAETAYSGTKTGLYYDASANGLRLDDGKRRGEYLFSVHLPQVYRARSWLEAKLIGVTATSLAWDDSAFDWTSEDAVTTVWNGACGDLGGAAVQTEIAEAAAPREGETIWTMDGTLLPNDLTAPPHAQHADTFATARWNSGLVLTPLTRLTCPAEVGHTFGLVFHLITDAAPAPAEIVTLRGTDGSLTLRYTDGAFCLIGTDGICLRVPYTTAGRDFLAIGIGQTATHRMLRIASLEQHTERTDTIPAAPCTAVTALSWHPC